MKIVNGDKPFIRFDENSGKIYGYGTLWQGKERLGCNMKTELKHICFIERSKTNSCEKIDKSLATNLIFNQVYMPKTPNETIATLKLIDRIMKNANLWIIKCNMEPNSAVVAYNEIFKKGKI